jgi:hypothetical protein
MDTNSFMELELIIRYLQSVNQHRDSILKINILQHDDNGLARMVVNADDIPCPPPRPKPRIFQCPGVKQVTWCPTPQPHYFIIGHPSAVILVAKHCILRKANRALGFILEQMDSRGSMLNWSHQCPPLVPRRSISTTPVQPQAGSMSIQHAYVEPISSRQSLRTDDLRSGHHTRRSDSSPSTSTYTPPPPTLTLNMPLPAIQSKPDDSGDDDMPVLMKNEDTSLGDFLGWLPKY